jgi:methionine biosynthesis protein MetW
MEIGYDIIIDEIPAESRVLDLGCGNGVLLERLQEEKNIQGFGVEISEEGISRCVEKGLFCYQGDIDEGLCDYKDDSFDYVILNQTLQSTKKPDFVLREIMRIGKTVIVSFPNFAYLTTRFQLLLKGTMPKNRLLPYEWYESPNIHLVTIRDFRQYCRSKHFPIRKELHFSLGKKDRSIPVRFHPNLYAQYGFFVLDGRAYTYIP